jgi:hypothetical protein
VTDAAVLTIRRMDFLSAVLGNPESAEVVEATVSARIASAPEVATV